MPTFTVLLTGGIASGKSTVEALFAQQGIACIDTDRISRQLTDHKEEMAQPILTAILQAFGENVFQEVEALILNRAALRQTIINDMDAKKTLEAIIHPEIFIQAKKQLSEANSPYALLSVPLFHSKSIYRDVIHRVLCINIAPELQMQRLMKRDGIDQIAAKKIINAQPSNAERMHLADDVINNSGEEKHLSEQVKKLHHQYLEQAVL